MNNNNDSSLKTISDASCSAARQAVSVLRVKERRSVHVGSTELIYVKENFQASQAEYAPDGSFLVLQRRGECRVSTNAGSFAAGAGDVFLLRRPGQSDILPKGLHEQLWIRVGNPADELTDVDGLKLSMGGFSGQLLNAIVRQADEGYLQSVACEEDANSLADCIDSLLSSVISESAGNNSSEMSIGHVKTIIDSRLASPLLSPKSIAAEAGISLRSMYRLFSEQGEQVSKYIQSRRIQKAASDLVDIAYIDQPIAKVGRRWGFEDPAKFSKAFKREMGNTPSAYKMLVRVRLQGASLQRL